MSIIVKGNGPFNNSKILTKINYVKCLRCFRNFVQIWVIFLQSLAEVFLTFEM